MTPQECWATYVGQRTPEQFVKDYDTRDPGKCADRFVREQGAVFGIVRHGTWPETFAGAGQHTRDTVVALLSTYLEETRAEWEAVPISAGPAATWDAIAAATEQCGPEEEEQDPEAYLHEDDAYGDAGQDPAAAESGTQPDDEDAHGDASDAAHREEE